MSLSERLCGARQGTCKGRSSLHAGKKPPCGRPSCYKAYKGYKEDLKSKRATASLLIKNNQFTKKNKKSLLLLKSVLVQKSKEI